ncbi:MAG TPA: type II secretion system protein [Candidatus Dojkabacteria bacterium]|nr:type II secretion system protein [Candidatus Dojkabacteria bacterium]
MLLKLKGITLVETLVYLALFGIIFTVMVEFSISIAQSNRSAELRQHLDRAKTFIIEHIDNSFLDTNSIDLNNSVFNNDQGKVRLNNLGYFEYYLENGVLKFNNTGTVYDITNTKVTVDRFYLEAAQVKTDTVGIRMTLEVSSLDGSESESIETLFIIR